MKSFPRGGLRLRRETRKRRRAEAASRQSEEQVRLLLNSTAEAIYGLDVEGRCTFVNASCLRMLGYSDPQQLVGRNIHYLIHHSYPDGRPMPEDECPLFRAVRQGEGVHIEEETLWRADGSRLLVECWSYPQVVNGRAVGVVVTFHDVSERKKTVETLREQTALLEAQMQATIDGIMVVDDERRIILANQRIAELFRIPPEIMGPNRDARELLRHVASMVPDPEEFTARVEYLYAHPGEEARDEVEFAGGMLLERYSGPVVGKDGRRYGRIWTFRDVTEARRAQELLREREERLRKQNVVLLRLVSRGALFQADVQQAIAEITEAGAALIGTERVSVWVYGEDCTEIRCIDLYRQSVHLHAPGETLQSGSFPSYTASHGRGEVIAAEDVLTDPRTRDIPSAYYAENGIRSLLDAPVWRHDRLGGLLSFEHVGERRAWTLEDERLATNMAALLSLCFEANERKQAEEALRASENQFKALFTESPISILIHDKDSGEIIDANHTAFSVYGYSCLDELKAGVFWMEPPYSLDDARGWFRKTLTEGPQQFEWLSRRVTGELFWEDIHLVSIVINGVERILATSVDITERKRLEQRLSDQLGFQQALLDTIPYPVFYKNAETRFLGCNSAYEEAFGVRREDFVGKRVLDLEYLPERDRATYQAEDEATIASAGSVRKEMPIPFADGAVHQTLYSVNGFRQTDGTPGGLIGVIVDISDLKRAESALRESEARFRAFMDHLPGYVAIKDADSRGLYFNQRFLETFPSWPGCATEDVLPPDEAAWARETDAKALAEGFVSFIRERSDLRGERRLLESRKFRIPQENGENLIGAIITDITERRYNEEKYRVLFHVTADAILMIRDNRIVDCNPRTLEVFGCALERMLGHSPGEFSPSVQPGGFDSIALAGEMLDRARGGDTHTFEWQHLRCDGTPFSAEVTLTVMSLFSEEIVVAFVRDISERKLMQDLMVQTEKMMSVGGLAAGMAHELNNPLGIIMQAVQNMELRFSPTLPRNAAVAGDVGLSLEALDRYMRARRIDEYMRGIQEAGERASRIIRTMLDFSRSGQSVRNVCQVSEMIDMALRLAANDYNLKKQYDFKSIVIEKDYDRDAGTLECSETEIVQVLLNIIKNAAQAMSGQVGRSAPPTLRLRARRLEDAVRIEIRDNGPGMDEAKRRRVFEPFFTTKPRGEGTGLGLSVSYFIVTQKHKGRIFAEPSAGGGTTFVIELPISLD